MKFNRQLGIVDLDTWSNHETFDLGEYEVVQNNKDYKLTL